MYFSCFVVISKPAEKNFLKDFKKGKDNSFEFYWQSFVSLLEKPEILLQRKRANIIHSHESISVCKCDFISKKGQSAKKSGSRCIFLWDKKEEKVYVLLVYSKKHVLKNQSETTWWKEKVSTLYPEYKYLIK